MLSLNEGLTKVYNRVHDPDNVDANVVELRTMQLELDYAVVKSYGWPNINLHHDFHETKQGIRYTINESARRELLDRLLALNHQRYEEEVQQGLHEKKKTRTTGVGKKKKLLKGQAELL